ncbi:uncharacterized protein N7443_001782 [Penicillium atrosanguineum]|uniref:uncharacterized protein n=1 Tax=Penicillium atrosanguineum TaxID=1132637 RepID=UPI00238F339D|nr:uncharacterized protein N7443_001782 [Penicillium atrosanguineum]KAJ5309321.1 hypothetical protein N7443_001782 [Penicillium atrosanguineum]
MITHTVPALAESTNAGISSGRVTTKEIRQVIEHLTHHRRANHAHTRHPDRTETSKNNQNELQTRNEKLHEEVQALRTQVEGLNAPTATRPWAAVAADANQSEPRKTRRHTDKEKIYLWISTRQSLDDSPETENNVNAFGRYLSTPTANTHQNSSVERRIHSRCLSRRHWYHEDATSAEVARNNKEWLNELGNDTRLVIPRFGMVVHRQPTD